MDRIMLLYTFLILCGLLQGANGLTAATDVTVELQLEGASIDGGNVDARLNDEVVVKCAYDGIPVLKVAGLYYKETETSQTTTQMLVAGSELQQPWRDRQDDFEIMYGTEDDFYISFKIKAVAMRDKGIYICTLNNNNGEILVQDQGKISVAANVEKVTIDGVYEGKYKVVDGDLRTVVKCTAYNGSKPEMFLRIEGKDEAKPFDVTTNGNEYVGTIYEDFTAGQNGKQITCEAIVPGYELDKVTASAFLEILATPEIDCPETVYQKVGQEITISCTVTGSPRPEQSQIVWVVQRTGHQVKAGESSPNLGLSSTIELDGDVYTVELTVTILNGQSYGNYVLRATNSGGTNTVYVAIEDKKAEKAPGGVVGGGASAMAACGSILLLVFTGYVLL